ncbi:MAG: hypothetical protein HOO96_29350 [Polyangiaceae bacterium]|nr:hypothetical protein [Polyangiaceae bacterium]
MKKIFLLTCAQLPEPDHDAPILDAALRARDLDPELLAWDADSALERLTATPGSLVVVRSTWNYYRHYPAFLKFVQSASSVARLCNPAEVIAWNTDKRYLEALAARGIAIVPTRYVEGEGAQGETLAALMDGEAWGDVVVKPRVSAGSFETHRFRRETVDESLFAKLRAERPLMVQPYLPSVETSGERSVVCFEGEVSHAIRKSPRFAGGAESVRPEPVSPDEATFARSVLAAAGFGPLLYARVDMARGPAGEPWLMELELTEPSLFLEGNEQAQARFADAIAARVR